MTTHKTGWVIALTGHRLADGRARHARRVDGAEHDPARPRRLGRAARVDGQRLQPELRRPADHGGGARRPLRAPQALRGRAGAVRGRLGRLRARARRRLADRGARRAGRRRGADHAARPRAAERRLPAREARRGDRDLQRDHRRSRSRAARSSAAPSSRGSTGSGSSGSTSRSGCVAIPLVLTRMRESRGPRHGARHPRPRARHRAARSALVWGLVRGNAAGWGSAEVLGALAAGALLARGLRRLGAARPRADAADAAVPLARVLGRQRGDLLHVRVAVQRASSSSPSSCRPGSATARSTPACG